MPDIRHELVIEAPAVKVYEAITTQSGLSAWWTPGTKAIPEVNSISRFPFGQEYFKEMRIIRLEPGKHVEWLCVTGADEWIGTSISFKIESGTPEEISGSHPEIEGQVQHSGKKTNGTVLTFHHDKWRNYTPMFAECNYTWGQFLRSLKLYCESGTGNPWPTQHQDANTQGNLKQAVPFFMVTDMDRSIQFYSGGLGFDVKIDWRPNGRIEWCWMEREGVALMLQEYREELRPKEKTGIGITVCFICRDALELYAEFQQKGMKPDEPFVGNQMWVTSLSDPDGYKLDFESYTDVDEETKYLGWIESKHSAHLNPKINGNKNVTIIVHTR